MIHVEAAEVSNYREGIILVTFFPGVGVDVSQAEEVIETVLHLARGKRHGNLVDARKLMFITGEARARFARQSPSCLTSTALVVGSAIQKTMGNLYLTVARPKTPTRICSSLEEGVRFITEQNRATVRLPAEELSSAPSFARRRP